MPSGAAPPGLGTRNQTHPERTAPMTFKTARRRFAATVAAAALALAGMTAAAVPARAADNDALARILLGAGSVFIIANALDKEKKRKRAAQQQAHQPPQPDVGYWHEHGQLGRHWHREGDKGHDQIVRDRDGWGHGRHGGDDRWRHDRRDGRLTLPQECRTEVEGYGRQPFYSGRCLTRAGLGGALPPSCHVRFGHDGRPQLYDGRCLEGAGFRTARHRDR